MNIIISIILNTIAFTMTDIGKFVTGFILASIFLFSWDWYYG